MNEKANVLILMSRFHCEPAPPANKQNMGDFAVPALPSLHRIHAHDSELAHAVKRLRAGILLKECVDGLVQGSSNVEGENLTLRGREQSLREDAEVLFVCMRCVFAHVFAYLTFLFAGVPAEGANISADCKHIGALPCVMCLERAPKLSYCRASYTATI